MEKFWLILDKVQIHKKRDFLTGEVKFYSFVSDGQLSLPELDGLADATNATERRAIVRSAGQTVLSQWESVEVDYIRADHIFEFGDTGKILFRSAEVPSSLDWVMLMIDVDDDVRTLGARMDELLPDTQVDALSGHILALLGTAASPTTMAAVSISKALIRGVSHLLKGNENDQLGVIEQSFVRPLHYPSGKRAGAGISDLSGNAWYDYTLFGMQ